MMLNDMNFLFRVSCAVHRCHSNVRNRRDRHSDCVHDMAVLQAEATPIPVVREFGRGVFAKRHSSRLPHENLPKHAGTKQTLHGRGRGSREEGDFPTN